MTGLHSSKSRANKHHCDALGLGVGVKIKDEEEYDLIRKEKVINLNDGVGE